MNKEESNDQCPAARASTHIPALDPARINAMIAAALGYLVEIQDGIVKCWERDEIPDETNWVPAVEFALREKLCREALEKRGLPFSVLPGDAGGWVCSLEINGKHLSTSAQSDEGAALALALYHVIREEIVKTDC